MSVNFKYYANGKAFTKKKDFDGISQKIIGVFEKHKEIFSENQNETNRIKSDKVLKIISEDLQKINFKVEVKHGELKREGKFCVDAYDEESGYAIEVEAARGVLGNQFYKDYFEACYVPEISYICIALRNKYTYKQKGKELSSPDFEIVTGIFDKFLGNGKVTTKLKGILIIGY